MSGHEVKLSSADRVLFPDDGITKGDLFALLRAGRRRSDPAPARPSVHDEALARGAPGRRVLPEAGAEGHAVVDPDAAVPDLAARGGRVAARRLSARQLARGAALDGADALHRHERVVLAGRQARPARLRALRPRPTGGGRRVRAAVFASRTASARRWTTSASSRTSRRAARTASTSSFRSCAGRRFDETYEFAELLSRRLEAEHPGEVTTEWLKKKRSGVLVDHRQNGWGKTIASVYSVRPKPGAPVSTPLRWDELTEDVQPARLLDGGRARAGRGARRPVRAGARTPSRRSGPR